MVTGRPPCCSQQTWRRPGTHPQQTKVWVLSLNSKFCSIRASILEQGYHMGFKWLMTNVLYWMTVLAHGTLLGGWTGWDRGWCRILYVSDALDYVFKIYSSYRWFHCCTFIPECDCWTVDVGIWIRYAVTSLLAQILYAARRETSTNIVLAWRDEDQPCLSTWVQY